MGESREQVPKRRCEKRGHKWRLEHRRGYERGHPDFDFWHFRCAGHALEQEREVCRRCKIAIPHTVWSLDERAATEQGGVDMSYEQGIEKAVKAMDDRLPADDRYLTEPIARAAVEAFLSAQPRVRSVLDGDADGWWLPVMDDLVDVEAQPADYAVIRIVERETP